MSYINFSKISIEKQIYFLYKKAENNIIKFLKELDNILHNNETKSELTQLKSKYESGMLSDKEVLNRAQSLLTKDIELTENKQRVEEEGISETTFDLLEEKDRPAVGQFGTKLKPTIEYTPNKEYLIKDLFGSLNSKVVTSAESGIEEIDEDLSKIITNPEKLSDFVETKKEYIEKIEQIGKIMQDLNNLTKDLT